MLRILMALEDYGERMFLQKVLKKIGFDVDAVQTVRALQESLLAMNPEVLLMTANGKKIKGLEWSWTVKKNRDLPRIVLMVSPTTMGDKPDHVDLYMNSPVSVTDLLNQLAELGNLNKTVLLEKLQRLQAQFPELKDPRVLNYEEGSEPSMNTPTEASGNFSEASDVKFVAGNLKPSTLNSQSRKDRYEKFLNEKPPENHGFSMKLVQDQVKSLREGRAQENKDELEKQRRAFVEELFKKNK